MSKILKVKARQVLTVEEIQLLKQKFMLKTKVQKQYVLQEPQLELMRLMKKETPITKDI